jgi:hypothetical protein
MHHLRDHALSVRKELKTITVVQQSLKELRQPLAVPAE